MSGTVIDSITQEPLAYATIRVLNANGTFFSGCISDSSGFFCFIQPLPEKDALMVIDMVGFKSKKIVIQDNSKKSLGKINMAREIIRLEEVTITGNQIGYKTMIDRTVLIPDSIMISNSMSLIDLAKKTPLLKVDKVSQEISIPGRSNTLVLIDGSYTGKNKNFATIPAESIEKIEIITHPSSKYDSEVGGVINIITKKEKSTGFKAFINLNYFLENKLNRSGFQVGYTWKKINVSLSYSLRYSNGKYSRNSYRQIDEGKKSYIDTIVIINPAKVKNTEHQINLATDFFMNKNNLMKFEINLSPGTQVNKSSYFTQRYYGRNTLNIYSFLKDESNYFQQNYSYYYKHLFEKSDHELSINANAYFLNRNRKADYAKQYLYTDNNGQTTTWETETDYEINSFTLIADYTYPIAEYTQLELGTNTYQRYIENSFFSENEISSFRYNDLRNAAYLNINQKIKNWGLQARVRAENLNININHDSIKRSNFYFLPNLSVLHTLDSKNTIKINYLRKLSYPYAGMLIPFVYFSSDSLSSREGNPYLKPEITDAIELNYRFRKNAYTFFSVSCYSNWRSDVIRPGLTTDGSLVKTMLINTAYENNFGIMLQAYAMVLQTFQMGIFNNFFYQSFNNSTFNGFGNQFSISLDMMLPADFNFGASFTIQGKEYNYQGYNYNSPLLDEIYLAKEIFKGQGEINISVMNAFFPNKETEKIWSSQVYEQNIYRFESFMVMFQFVWSMKSGKEQKAIKKKNIMEHDIGNTP
ncbi:MAG: outer membrane beta-barrel protein [Acholeplasmataceae bacterium]|nr:outer membrane beta-barrel protein [Acholeplasmataceae bacterium]